MKTRSWPEQLVTLGTSAVFLGLTLVFSALVWASPEPQPRSELMSAVSSPAQGWSPALLARKQGRGTENHFQQWQQLSPQERKKLREKYQKWQDMSPREKELFKHRHEQWERLSPEDQQELKHKLKNWDSLPAWEQDQIRRRFRQ